MQLSGGQLLAADWMAATPYFPQSGKAASLATRTKNKEIALAISFLIRTR